MRKKKEAPNCSRCKWFVDYTKVSTVETDYPHVCTAQGYRITIQAYGSKDCEELYEERDYTDQG